MAVHQPFVPFCQALVVVVELLLLTKLTVIVSLSHYQTFLRPAVLGTEDLSQSKANTDYSHLQKGHSGIVLLRR